MAANNYMLPPPPALEIHDPQAAEKWKKFKRAWISYSLATALNEKSEAVQVATLLTVIGEEAREVFSTFSGWANEGDSTKIEPVLAKFEQYCQPRKHVPFERYRFNRRVQEAGETYDQYRTALRKLAEGCDFGTITPDEILRDRLVFGIRDAKTRERLLRESELTLERTDEMCHAAESMMSQMKVFEDSQGVTVNTLASGKEVKTAEGSPKPKRTRECWNCGRRHEFHKRELCPAYGKTCLKCKKLNHFAHKCRGKGSSSSIRIVNEEENGAEVEEETFTMEGLVATLDDSQVVTLRLESGCHIRFQVDTGAQCNVLPLELYKKATKDVFLTNVTPIQSRITAYGGTTLPVVGTVLLRVWRGDYRCRLDCKLVDHTNIRPLLGRKACIGMKIITYLDNDQLNKPHTGDDPVYMVEGSALISTDQLIQRYPLVFGEGVGQLEGKYHIRVDTSVNPVQHAPRRVPVPLREVLRKTLEDLTRQSIIAPVQKPTPWVNSMVVVPKKNGTLRICLDPRDLNQAIRREHYPLPTIEDVATRLHGAKLFTVLDVRKGFWHVELDEPSSYLTTFNTPFGRYRWKRMPFGICSAPEVFQRRMHELIEGLSGVEVIADDFVAVGFGDTVEDAEKDHDRNLEAFLHRCAARGVKLNADKVRLRLHKVPFIGHVATDQGLSVDPDKVHAILEMPQPTDVAAVRRLLGMAQYLSKFLPHLADITKPLRELTQKDTEWVWDHPQQTAFDALRKAVASTPILRYYNLEEEVTIQCDSSQYGLGAALMQDGQPVAYVSRALTSAETRYAQIEKELLAIVFACDRFEPYIYGRKLVHVETDHQPLEMIVRKPLNTAPKRLQRMLLQLQKYCLSIKYKRGQHMYLADTLSRAYLPHAQVCAVAQELVDIDQAMSLTLPADQLQRIQHASADDPVLTELRKIIHQGWPGSKFDVPDAVCAYYDIRDELTTQDQLVFKGPTLVIPIALRKEMMAVCHATHIGMEGCIRRARESMFWPRMSSELKEYIAKCDVCMAHRASPGKETLQQHEVVERPWAKVGADLCDLQGRTLLVVCDYFSNFIEVESLQTVTSRSVCKALKIMFARYGSPDILVTDNGPQFSSAEFATFARVWSFNHVTSSPRYPQSNGKAENAVKTVKRLFSKCREAGQSEYKALLDWRNTPSEGIGTSPAQRFLGRRCKTLLPMTGALLQPKYPTIEDTRALQGQKERQKYYYNQHARDLQPIAAGDSVRMRLPGQSTWTKGVCTGLQGPRSYGVKVGETEYRRNRRQIIRTKEIPDPELTDSEPREVPTTKTEDQQGGMNSEYPSPPLSPPENAPTPDRPSTPVRRSGRVRKSPEWIMNYVPS